MAWIKEVGEAVDDLTSSIAGVKELKVQESNGAARLDSSTVNCSISSAEEAGCSSRSGGNVRSSCSTVCSSDRRLRACTMPKLASWEALR